MRPDSYLEDPHFQDMLIGLLVYDREFCKEASHLLSPDDFQGEEAGAGTERQNVARVALEFYNRYRQPVAKMLRPELVEFINRATVLGPKRRDYSIAGIDKLLEYADTLRLQKTNGFGPPEAALVKVLQFRTDKVLSRTLTDMSSELDKGLLSMDEFLRRAHDASEQIHGNGDRPVSIFSDKQLELRMARRELQLQHVRYPSLLIDPIDRMIRIIARKHLGLVLAPYKRGKTMFFVWLALAYVIQSLNVLHFTLEDPKEDIEDRFDAAITNLPLSRLTENPDKVRTRFQRFKKYAKTKLKVVEGTDGDMSIQKVEAIYEKERNRGFTADVILIDYDDEVKPRMKRDERRMEFADIYRDFRAMLSRHELIGWTASQTSRKSEDMKIIGGKETAEDISKMRKASFVMSIGKGDWGEDSVFLWVPAHRYDRMHVGANIIMNKERSLFYDRDATLQREKSEIAKKENAE